MLNDWLKKVFGASWKTSVAGLLALVAAILEILSSALGWTWLTPELRAQLGAAALAILGVGTMTARQNDVTSEDVQAQKKKQ